MIHLSKTCSKCKQELDLTAFHSNRYGKLGKGNWCKTCKSEHAKKRYAENREHCRNINKKYREKDPEEYRKKARRWWANNLDARRASRLKYKYRISVQEYDTLFLKQKGLCAMCGNPGTARNKGCLNIDHDHKTKKVRGLLCSRCNRALGFIESSRCVLGLMYLASPPTLRGG